MDWFREEISRRYVVKFRARLDAEDKDDRAVRILNRIVEWRKEGIWYEPDQRHAEIIRKELRLEKDSKGLGSPNYKRGEGEDQRELDAERSRKYRQLVARGNYLAQDRADIQYAVKELSRTMSMFAEEDWKALKKLGRYLVKRPRGGTL